jgi:hypothetical protein
MLTRLLRLAVVTQIVLGCAVVPPDGPTIGDVSLQSQQGVASAELALQELDEIDTLIKLDNRLLAEQISSALNAQAELSATFSLRNLKVRFGKQYIALDSELEISGNSGNVISASVHGNVFLDISGKHLQWFPRFDQLEISTSNFSFEQGSYAEATPELNQLVLQRLNADITDELMLYNNNAIPLNPVPLGTIEVGATLPAYANADASQTEPLNVAFIVTGSAMLIEPSVTSIALDLSFKPNLSYCAADITVSRSGFISSVNGREPAGLARNMNDAEGVRYFYSEISAATRPLTLIHYWFADGQLLLVEELPVEPSERWRTWSSRDGKRTDASHWEVLVVDKDSACIIHSQSIRTLEAESTIPQAEQSSANRTFTALRQEFNRRVAGFSIAKDKPDIALIEVRRLFMRDGLQTSLTGMHLEAGFDQAALGQLQFSAQMMPFETADIVCEHRSCPPAPPCEASLTQCKRLRDTRDCSSCLFRNPLNNRCVNEAEDPICESARDRQNFKYDADWTNCIANADAAKLDCEQLGAQALRSCEIESGFEQLACEAVKSSLASLNKRSPLATSQAEAVVKGRVSIVFSNISIDDDFTRLKMDMGLKSNMKLSGKLKFNPTNLPQTLVSCITGWNAPFSSRAVSSPAVNSMLTTLSEHDGAFTASWSGYLMPLEIIPSPLESVFVGNPNLLANCSIGLTVDDVERAFTGSDAEFFTGKLELEIQPQPTMIYLSPATMKYGKHEFQGKAVLSSTYVRYDIAD